GGVDAHDRQTLVQHTHDGRAHDSAGDASHATLNRRAADEHRGDRVELVEVTRGGHGRSGTRSRHDRRNGGHDADVHEDVEVDPPGLDSGHHRGEPVATHCVDVP